MAWKGTEQIYVYHSTDSKSLSRLTQYHFNCLTMAHSRHYTRFSRTQVRRMYLHLLSATVTAVISGVLPLI